MPKKTELAKPDCEAELRYVQTLLGHAELKLQELQQSGLPKATADDPECIDEVRRYVKHAQVFTSGACHKVDDALRTMHNPDYSRTASKARVRDLEDRVERLLEEAINIQS